MRASAWISLCRDIPPDVWPVELLAVVVAVAVLVAVAVAVAVLVVVVVAVTVAVAVAVAPLFKLFGRFFKKTREFPSKRQK